MQVCNVLTNKKDIKSIIHGSLQGGNKKPDWMKQQRNFTCNILFLSWKKKLKWQDVSGFLFWMLEQDTYYAVIMSWVR